MKYVKIFLLVIITLIIACNKENQIDNSNPEYNEVLSSFLKPYMFKNGSYWVYQNDSTGILDSIALISTSHGFFEQPPGSPGTPSHTQIEYYRINLHDYLTSSDYDDFLFGSILTRNGNEHLVFGQPVLILGFSIGYEIFGTFVYDTSLTININGNLFTKVREMKINHTLPDFPHDTYMYFRDSIGMLKKVIDFGNGNFESWSLKRKNIVL
jgi:hypothetical protein